MSWTVRRNFRVPARGSRRAETTSVQRIRMQPSSTAKTASISVHHFSPSGTCPRSAMQGSIQAYAQFKGEVAMGRARGVPVRRGGTHVKQHDEGNEEEAEDKHRRRATAKGTHTSAAGELADRRAAERASARSHGRLERALADRKGTRGHSGARVLQCGRPTRTLRSRATLPCRSAGRRRRPDRRRLPCRCQQ